MTSLARPKIVLRVVRVLDGGEVLYTDSRCPGRTGRCSRSHFCALIATSAQDRAAANDWSREVIA